jgi:hypothetical protein
MPTIQRSICQFSSPPGSRPRSGDRSFVIDRRSSGGKLFAMA